MLMLASRFPVPCPVKLLPSSVHCPGGLHGGFQPSCSVQCILGPLGAVHFQFAGQHNIILNRKLGTVDKYM